MSAVADDANVADVSASRAHWLLALRHLALPVLVVALPLFLYAGWGLGSWALCAVLWAFNRLIQSGVTRFVLGLPPTAAMGVASVAFLTRAWGTMIVLIASVHFWGKDVAVPAAILFAVLYTIDIAARGLSWADGKRIAPEAAE